MPVVAQAHEILLKTDDQILQVARLFRKAEAFDTTVDLLNEIDSIKTKLAQTIQHTDGVRAQLETQLRAELYAVEQVLKRHVRRLR